MKRLDAKHIYSRCNQMRLVKDGKDHPGYMMTTLACSIIKLTDNPDYSVLYRNDPTTEEQVQHMLESSVTQNPASCQSFTNANPEGCIGCLENVRSPLLLANDYITLQLQIPEKVETVIEDQSKDTNELTQLDVEDYNQFLIYVSQISTLLNENLDKTIVLSPCRATGLYAQIIPTNQVCIRSVKESGLVQIDANLMKKYVRLTSAEDKDKFYKVMTKYLALISRQYVNMLEYTDYSSGYIMCYSLDTTKLKADNKGASK